MNIELLKELIPFDIFIDGKKITDSTNANAKEHYPNCGFDKAVYIADMQTRGRGRLGRTFESPGAGIYMSVVVPFSAGDDAGLLTTNAAVCVCKAIEQLTDKKPLIKWVNDIFLDGKKICGILCEAVLDGNFAVVGIGINFKKHSAFSEEISRIAGFLFDSEEQCTREALIAEIIKNLYSEDFDMDEYRKRMFLRDRTIYYIKDGIRVQATAIDVDDKGGLIIKRGNETQVLRYGEISVKTDKEL